MGIKIEQIHNISALECSLFGTSSGLTFTMSNAIIVLEDNITYR
uniref:Uncharacterized protein n=1 Tax=uncultured prokaryote TaxID=198431 RepID=A0A0H5PWF9_9ZZZZ|nr:hypothetical protein [uncultured prokaryote]